MQQFKFACTALTPITQYRSSNLSLDTELQRAGRDNKMRKIQITLMFALVMLTGVAVVKASILTVQVNGFVTDDGRARIVLMSGEQSYRGS